MFRTTLYHITVLSNFARGFDKYTRYYSKAGIPESSYPDRFFLLRRDELGIGVQKAARLLERLALPGNRLIALETEVDEAELHSNRVNGRGQFINSSYISITGLHEVEHRDSGALELHPVGVEDTMAASLRLLIPSL